MGKSDNQIFKEQKLFFNTIVSREFMKPHKVSKIAFLGNPYKNPTCQHYEETLPDATSHFYDIKLNNWDINKEWDIEGYDLVVCHRTTSYFDGSTLFFKEQLEKCLSKNKYVIFDFTMYAGLFKSSLSERVPPGENVMFDFRSLFLKQLKTKFNQNLPKHEHLLRKELLEKSLQLKEEYSHVFDDSVDFEMLETLSVLPKLYILGQDQRKLDLYTYVFWENESL